MNCLWPFQVPLEGFKALQGLSGPQHFQIHKAYGAPERLPSAHTWLDLLTEGAKLECISVLQCYVTSRTLLFQSIGVTQKFIIYNCSFNQLDLPEYSSKEQLEERLLLSIHEASEGFGFG